MKTSSLALVGFFTLASLTTACAAEAPDEIASAKSAQGGTTTPDAPAKDDADEGTTTTPSGSTTPETPPAKPAAKAVDEAHVENVPLVLQNPELPRGCEVTSLTMLLRHAGVTVDKMTLASEIDKVPYTSKGLHGNPNDGFVGNMYDFAYDGYGVYHAPVKRLADRHLPGRIVDLTGGDFDALLQQTVAQGQPLWVIANARFASLASSEWQTWKTSSGDVKITWHEHSVVVVGFDRDTIFINDPLDTKNGKNKALDRAKFRDGWKQIGSQAISYTAEK